MNKTVLFIVMCAVLSAITWATVEVRTDITDFLPHDQDSSRIQLARELARGPQARTVVITISAQTGGNHIQAAKGISKRLAQSGLFRWVRTGLDETAQRAVFELYFPARLGFLEPPEKGPVPSAWIAERVKMLRNALASPLGLMIRPVAPEDPLAAMVTVFDELERSRGELTIDDGQLVTKDGRHAVIFASTRGEGLNADAQRHVAALIDREKSALAKAGFTLEWTSVGRYAIHGEMTAKQDISRISLWSTIGMVALYLFVFRSLKELFIGSVPLLFSGLLALVLCQLLYGSVHAITLAFGASIIGVAIDYPTHYFMHLRASPKNADTEMLMRELWPGIVLAGATTVFGILALAAGGLPGLTQMAVFGAVGVAAALWATRVFMPAWSGSTRRAKDAEAAWLVRLLRAMAQHRKLALLGILAVLLSGLSAFASLRFADGITALRTPAPSLERETERVYARLGKVGASRVFASFGKNEDEALLHARQLALALARAHEQKKIEEYRSPTALLRPASTQRATFERFARDPTFLPRLREALETHGFVPAAFAKFEDLLRQPSARVITAEDVLSSPLANVIEPLRLVTDHETIYLTPVAGGDPTELQEIARRVGHTHFLDQRGVFDDAYAQLRTRVTGLLTLGLGLVLAVLWLRYRNLRLCLVGLLPALLGSIMSIACLHWLGMPLQLLHFVGIVLVLSMGVDYGVYLLESRETLHLGVTSLGSVLLAALTTVLSFGLLALSSSPALAAIGFVVSIGLTFALLAAPITLSLVWNEASA